MIPDKKIEVNMIEDVCLLYFVKRYDPTAAFLENIIERSNIISL